MYEYKVTLTNKGIEASQSFPSTRQLSNKEAVKIASTLSPEVNDMVRNNEFGHVSLDLKVTIECQSKVTLTGYSVGLK